MLKLDQTRVQVWQYCDFYIDVLNEYENHRQKLVMHTLSLEFWNIGFLVIIQDCSEKSSKMLILFIYMYIYRKIFIFFHNLII